MLPHHYFCILTALSHVGAEQTASMAAKPDVGVPGLCLECCGSPPSRVGHSFVVPAREMMWGA